MHYAVHSAWQWAHISFSPYEMVDGPKHPIFQFVTKLLLFLTTTPLQHIFNFTNLIHVCVCHSLLHQLHRKLFPPIPPKKWSCNFFTHPTISTAISTESSWAHKSRLASDIDNDGRRCLDRYLRA